VRRFLAALLCASLGIVAACGDASTKDASEHIRRLSQFSAADVAGVGISFPASDEQFGYALSDGRWRCATASDALALAPALERLIDDLTHATGLSREVPGARLAAYGFGEQAPVVQLYGKDMRPLSDERGPALFEIGKRVAEQRTYVRLQGSAFVWEIDRVPHRHFEREVGDRLPPMLDRRLLAGELPESGGGFTRAFLDFADGRSLELQRVVGAQGYAWELAVAATEPGTQSGAEWAPVPALPYRVAGWQSFLYRSPYVGFAAPAEAERLGLAEPWLRMTLVDVEGTIELAVAAPIPNTPLAVLNSRSKMIVLLAPELAPLVAPTTADLVDRTLTNRWEAWLGAGAIRRQERGALRAR